MFAIDSDPYNVNTSAINALVVFIEIRLDFGKARASAYFPAIVFSTLMQSALNEFPMVLPPLNKNILIFIKAQNGAFYSAERAVLY